MDWQDELRRLDKQLSEGEISAQEYRRMRDELLAEASAPAQGRGSLWSSARPDSPPPPFPAAPPAPGTVPAPDADDTQIVADTTVTVDKAVVHAEDRTEVVDAQTVAGLPAEEQTQVVREPLTQPAPDRAPEPAPERPTEPALEAERPTEADPVAEPVSGPFMRPAPMPERPDSNVPTFPPRPSDTPPPSAPPLPPPAPWSGHQVIGEEVFADAKPHSAGRRAATAAFSLLVVLAVIGGAVWFFVFRSDDAPAAQAGKPPATEKPQSQAPPTRPPSSAPPASSAPVPVPGGNLADVLGPLPGAADKNSGTITAARAGQLKLVSPAEVNAAQEAKVSDVIFRGSTNGSVGVALLVFTTPNGQSAGKLMGAERAYLLEHGFSNGKDLASSLPVLERKEGGATVYRVVYSTGKYTVRFGVAQRDANPQELRKSLEAVADNILAVLPPS
ncbi:MAG TPA: hypothetical protein VGP26_05370 [Actinophytocola sp.]|jgi:hypothetical protein|nr:hypothetical protein [Actinophytocola sp.]